jgi:hypothetical protein
MKRKAKSKIIHPETSSQPTIFETLMNLNCELRTELNFQPLPHWKQTRPAPTWTKNIYQKLAKTVFKPILKLRPKRKGVNWRNYGRCIGLMERYKTFLLKDAPQILKAEGLTKLSKKRAEKLQAAWGEEQERQYYLKILGRPTKDKTRLEELRTIVIEKSFTNLEMHKQRAFFNLTGQSARTTKMFLKGMSEGYICFLNEAGLFSADDRRADIHFELLAWQHDIEKMRLATPQKQNKHLVDELKKLREFNNKTQDWFADVFKDIKLSIGRRGRPPAYCQA